uniref:Vestigial-like family member 2a n=1 Tax=Oryzias latipes TaxID=8090 RepID=A0A3P9IC20_ORYLA
MSCLDVMYQVFGPQPYFSSYSPFHHQKLALYSKMQPPQENGGRLGTLGPVAIKEEDKELPPGAEYLSSRCVLFTYFRGDISAVVDEHFSRALSQATAYPPSGSHKALRGSCLPDGSFPMSQRSFPPSFWNSSYQPPVSSTLGGALSAPHSDLSFAGDPYSSSPLHSHLHQPGPDAWHPSHHHHHPYSLGGGIGAQSYARAGVHEMYSTAFDPRYGSLLVPSVRSHHRLVPGSSAPGPSTSPCDLGSKGESGGSAWSSTFTSAGAEIGLNMDSGLPAQDKSKDLYWF